MQHSDGQRCGRAGAAGSRLAGSARQPATSLVNQRHGPSHSDAAIAMSVTLTRIGRAAGLARQFDPKRARVVERQADLNAEASIQGVAREKEKMETHLVGRSRRANEGLETGNHRGVCKLDSGTSL